MYIWRESAASRVIILWGIQKYMTAAHFGEIFSTLYRISCETERYTLGETFHLQMIIKTSPI